MVYPLTAKLACAGLIVLAAPMALAQEIDFTGIYRQGPASACHQIGVDGGAIEINGKVFRGVESECQMTRPVNVVDMNAMLFDMKCKGEGTEWEARAMFMTAVNGGLIMVWDGYAFQYDRCEPEDLPAPSEASAETTNAGTEADADDEAE